MKVLGSELLGGCNGKLKPGTKEGMLNPVCCWLWAAFAKDPMAIRWPLWKLAKDVRTLPALGWQGLAGPSLYFWQYLYWNLLPKQWSHILAQARPKPVGTRRFWAAEPCWTACSDWSELSSLDSNMSASRLGPSKATSRTAAIHRPSSSLCAPQWAESWRHNSPRFLSKVVVLTFKAKNKEIIAATSDQCLKTILGKNLHLHSGINAKLHAWRFVSCSEFCLAASWNFVNNFAQIVSSLAAPMWRFKILATFCAASQSTSRCCLSFQVGRLNTASACTTASPLRSTRRRSSMSFTIWPISVIAIRMSATPAAVQRWWTLDP